MGSSLTTKAKTSILPFVLFFSLLAGAAAAANTIDPSPDVNIPHTEKETSPSQSTTPLQDMEVTQPPPQESGGSFFYKYERSLSIHMGPYYSEIPTTYWVYGFTYLWQYPLDFHLETGLDSVTYGEGQIWTVARWNYRYTKKLRPYLAGGFGIRLVPSNGLATFLESSNVFARCSSGLEYSISGPTSLRLDVFGAYDFGGRSFLGGTLGLTVGI